MDNIKQYRIINTLLSLIYISLGLSFLFNINNTTITIAISCAIASCFHLFWTYNARHIIELVICRNYTNPYRWMKHWVVGGILIYAIMESHPIPNIILCIVCWGAGMSFLYYNDQYMAKGNVFVPPSSPNTFAIPTLLVTAGYIGVSTNNVVYMSSWITHIILMVAIQYYHIVGNNTVNGDTTDNSVGENIESDIDDKSDILEKEMVEIKRALLYDILFSLNAILLHIVITIHNL